MTIAMSDGTTYKDSLDMLFSGLVEGETRDVDQMRKQKFYDNRRWDNDNLRSPGAEPIDPKKDIPNPSNPDAPIRQVKDMPSREETDRQQQDKRTQELTGGLDREQKMKDMDTTMPHDMRGPPPALYTPNEQDYYQHQEQYPKDQNAPSAWGMDEAIGRTGPAMVPYPDPQFHEIMDHIDYLIDPEGVQKAQAGPYNKDTTPAPQQPVEDVYEDQHGQQRSRKNDAQLEQFNSFTDKFAKGLTEKDVELLKYWYRGEYNGSRPTEEDLKAIEPLRDIVESQVEHLPKSERNGDELNFKNWGGLLMDKILKQHESLNPGRRSDAEDALPPNARPTSEETPPKSAYQNFTDKLEELSKSLNPSFIPTAEQFRDAPWKEKLGFILASSFMFAGPGRGPINKGAVRENVPTSASDPLRFWQEGLAEYDKVEHPVINTLRMAEKEGSQTATNLLETYRKIDDPVVRAEFSKIVKDKISAAAEGGETSPSNITNPEIKRWTPEEDTALKDVAKSGKIDFENLPPELEGRSVGSLLNRARDLKVLAPSERYVRQPGDSEGYGPRESKYQDKFPDIIKSIKEGKTYADIARDIEMKPESLRQLIKSRPELRSVYDETNPTPKGNTPWTPAEIKALRTWHADPDNDLFEPPAMLKHRSPGAIDTMIEKLKLNKEADAAPSSKPFVPQGAVRAPETGGGSGGPVNTETSGKSGIRTPSSINDPEFRALQAMRKGPANSNEVNPGQIDNPAMDAAIDKMWKNMGAANEKSIPLISPLTAERLKAINPTAFKKLQQFELEMDYKHKSQDRQWLSDLEPKDIKRYQDLYEQAQKEPPRDVNDIKYRIRQMLTSPEAQKILKEEAASKRPKNSFQKFLDALKDEEP